jgi:hypothetical protein
MFIILGTIIVLAATGWLGLQVKPEPFPAYSEQTLDLNTIKLPAGLPQPPSHLGCWSSRSQCPGLYRPGWPGDVSARDRPG